MAKLADLACVSEQSTVVAVVILPPTVWRPKWTEWAAPTLVLSSQVNPYLEAFLTDTAAVVRRKVDFVPSHGLAHKACFAVGFAVKNAAVATVASNRNGLVKGLWGPEDAAHCTEVYSRAHCLSL